MFTLRSIAGTSPGLAWGIATLGAGLRWGTFGLGDLESATRLLGPTVTAGSPIVRAGMVVALVGAVVDESRQADISGASWLSGAARVAAAVALVPAFIVAGPVELSASAIAWAAAAAGVIGGGILVRSATRRLPWWLPLLLVAVGITAAAVAL